MSRTRFLIVAAFLVAGLAMLVNTTVLRAQCPGDCTFRLTANCAIPQSCFPFTFTTAWTNGITTVTQNNTVTGCGFHSTSQPSPCPPAGAPYWGIAWASLDGGTTRVYPNGPQVQYTLPCGETVCINITFSPTGCASVNVYLC